MLPLALTGLLALSACQFAGDDDPAGDAHRLNSMQAFPLHAYYPDPDSDDAKVIGKAEWVLGKKCMVGLGFPGFATLDTRTVEATYPVRRGYPASSSMPGDDSPYGVDDPDRAADHGYHNREQDDSSQPMEWPVDQYVALTGRYETGDSRRAHGHPIPEGGCLGEAGRKIYGPPPKARKVNGVRVSGSYTTAAELWSKAARQARKDPAWKKADRAWSDCMREKGFHYSEPDKALYDSAWYGTAGSPSGKEKKTAAADAQCKLDTDYITDVHAVETRFQKAAIGKHKKELGELRAAVKQAVETSRTIIDKASRDARPTEAS
ncbi:hypothetical protein ACGFT2_27170 [Streptomyces sp. NPDC048514]|uniref:hypothetical protein n=1 Tax=Streptomyces sp. NPDC048514 TaxID=3365564 RepID=UPI00371B5606